MHKVEDFHKNLIISSERYLSTCTFYLLLLFLWTVFHNNYIVLNT